MLAVRPSISQVIIKTNEGVSGAGNALVDLTGVADLPESKTFGDQHSGAGHATGVAEGAA